MKEKAIKEIFDFFIKSSDFNGIPLSTLTAKLGIEYDSLLPLIKELILENIVSIQGDINPHIIRLGHYGLNVQLEYLKSAENNVVESLNKTIKIDHGQEFDQFNFVTESHLVCAYPTQNYLHQYRDVSTFETKPYSKKLAFGEAQLSPIFFDLDVLERYFIDPRYNFQFEDYRGQISIIETEEQKSQLREPDQVFLKTFGLGYDNEDNRVIVVYIRYLSDLTPEHQLYWKTKEMTSPCKMVKDYYENTIRGAWSSGYSLFSAFIEEQGIINEMSKLITGKYLFRETYNKIKRPKEFTFFTSPTLFNYESFISLLDKLISQNINNDFFDGYIEKFELKKISESVFERKEKGTLKLLEEWLRINFQLVNEDGYKILFSAFKKVRVARQKPAHKISDNYYDKKFFKNQMELLKEVYFSMHGLRCILQQHPSTQKYEIPKWILNGSFKEY